MPCHVVNCPRRLVKRLFVDDGNSSVDDILVWIGQTKNILLNLYKVFTRLEKADRRRIVDACTFTASEVIYLGDHIKQGRFARMYSEHIIGNRSAEATVEKLLTTFGIPDTVLSGHGTSFVSEVFQTFVRRNGIRHITVAPKYSASNGQAELSIQLVR